MTDEQKRTQAHDLLDRLAELSGWDKTLEALHTIFEIDTVAVHGCCEAEAVH